jgi:hypothetical protein
MSEEFEGEDCGTINEDHPYYLGGQASSAITGLSEFLEKPEHAYDAMQNLFNIALVAAYELNKVRRSNPELAKRFAGDRTQWPYWLSPGLKGWKEDGVPPEIWEILHDLGMGEADGAWPIGGTEDRVGRVIKSWRSAIAGIRSDPDADPVFSGHPEVHSPYGDYYHKHVLDLPNLGKDKPSCRAWAKAIFDLIFIEYSLSNQVPDSFNEEGVAIVEIEAGKSEYFDKSFIAYSLLRPSSDTFMENKIADAQTKWDESQRIATSSLNESPTDEEVRAKTEEIFKRMYDSEAPEEIGDHPTDKKFRTNAVAYIMGRLKGMVP